MLNRVFGMSRTKATTEMMSQKLASGGISERESGTYVANPQTMRPKRKPAA